MKLFYRNIFALLAVSATLFTSCSDDVLNKEGEGKEAHGVILYLPEMPEGAVPATGTRSEGELAAFTRAETTVSNCKLFIYAVDGAGRVEEQPVTDYVLKRGDSSLKEIPGYGAYQLEDIPTGSYKMYVTANVNLPANTKYSDLLNKSNTIGLMTDPSLGGGLPMSCAHEDLEVNGNRINGHISIEPGVTSMSIKANLKFAVSKVRVTMINDLKPKDEVKGVTVNKHVKTATVFGGLRNESDERQAVASGTETYDVTSWGKYYNAATIANSGVASTQVESLGNPIAFNGSTPYTYQTVFYVPERLFQTENDCTTATLKIGNTEKQLKLGHNDNDGYGFALKRSHFYDYIGVPDGNFSVRVQYWDMETIVGALNGTYWLKLDKTAVSIRSGEKAEIKYESNTDIVPDCKKYGDDKIYTFTKKDGALYVSLNNSIDRSEFDAIYASGDWKYFTITAGTIIKKIEVENFDFAEYINEDKMVTIDVAERKTSGEYSYHIPVTLNTNLEYVIFEKVGWPAEANEGSPASLILQDKNGQALNPNQVVPVPASGEIEFRVAFNDLNGKRKLWQDDHNMEVVVKGVDANGNVIMRNGEAVKCTVGVYVRTSYDVYRIHLKAPSWKHPHIYVYQCLQLPGEFDTSRNGAKPRQTVGYHSYNDSYAALEYDFTGAVAFKGWFVNKANDPYAYGYEKDHFFMFNDNYKSVDNNWSPSDLYYDDNHKEGTENLALKNGLHYYRMDFASVHRKKIKDANRCSACTATNIPTTWPGIHMIPDPTKPANSGWWYFELSGVADPGKALVMFTDCNAHTHKYDGNMENNRRYPEKEAPGVALFDNPTKEGWFVFKDTKTPTSFLSVDPDNQ